jgi:Pyridine nucleotide-disulphide oxidoreductase
VADLVLGGTAPQVLDVVSAFVRPLAIHIRPDNHYLAFLSRLITEEGGYGGLGDVRTGASVITLRTLLRRLLPQFSEAVIEERWWLLGPDADAWRWKEEFATQPEIESYLNFVADRFDLRKHIRTGERVSSAAYDEASGAWVVLTEKGTVVRARWVISATGALSVPHYTEIDGLDDFGGQAYHTGAWPHTPVDFAGKRVAIIGNGPSGAQLLPAIADIVASVDLYQRTPTWTTPFNKPNVSLVALRETRSCGSTRPASRPPSGTVSTTSSCTRPGSTSAPARSPGWASPAARASTSASTGRTGRPTSPASARTGCRTSSSRAGRTGPGAATTRGARRTSRLDHRNAGLRA